MSEESTKLYENISIEHKEGSEVEITGEIPLSAVDIFRSDAIKTIGKTLEIDGFRKGNAPESVVAQKVGESQVMQEVAETVLTRAYAEIVVDNKIDVIGKPAVSITKLAPGNPIGFTIRSAVMPEITLPDYKKIGVTHQKEKIDLKELEASDEEVTNVINDVRKREAHAKMQADNPEDQETANKEIEEKDWPEFTDETAQKLGDFKDVADFKDKIKKNIALEKEHKAREQKRIALADEIVANTNVDLPAVFVDSELEKMVHEFQANVTRMGLNFEDYLKRVGKTEEEMREEWKPEAAKRATLQLALNEIARKEELVPEKEKVDREVAHLLEHYKDAEEDRARTYVESLLTNELVFDLLEGKEQAKKETTEK